MLDALVRKSLVVADRSSGRTRFSMLETIRQFAEELLVPPASRRRIRNAHSQYFATREADILALWNGHDNARPTNGSPREIAQLRIAFRWSVDSGDLDTSAAIAFYAGLVGIGSPTLGARQLGRGTARAVLSRIDHGLTQLLVVAAQCFASRPRR